ncbi:MAG: integrin alpha [Candidatus Hodarchaeota archaeon]
MMLKRSLAPINTRCQVLILILSLFLLTSMKYSRPAQALNQDMAVSQASASFIGEEANDRAGYSIASAGDVNQDGFDDFLIGAYWSDEGGADSGKVYLILGREDVASWNTSGSFDLEHANASFIGENADDWAGYCVAGAGDVNRDGFDDILIGAYSNNAGGTEAGQVYLILGRADVSQWKDSNPLNLNKANASFVGEEANDRAGWSVAGAGDVNKDGYADILIGANGNDEGSTDAGKSYLILGRADVTLWNGGDPLDLSYANASFIGEEDSDFSGIEVAGAGDVNADGYDDILIGAHYNDDGAAFAGQTYLILGRQKINLWNGSNSLDLAYANASFVGEDMWDYSGYRIAGAGDTNNDGYADILIGAYGNEEGGLNAGQTYLILGRENVTLWNGTNPLNLGYANASFIGENSEDESASSVAGVGDVNGDGYDDILIGSHGNDEGHDAAGQSYLILGRPTTQWSMDIDLSQADASFIGEAFGDAAGFRLGGAGDVNNDGFFDFLIGAPYNREAGLDAGKTYLFLGTLAPAIHRMNVVLQAIAANNVSIDVSFIVEDYYGNGIDTVQMWVSNGTDVWTGSTSLGGQFNISLSYTTSPFILEVNATKDYYFPDHEFFAIYIDPVAVKYDEPVPEWNPSVLAILGLLGLALIGPWLAIWRKRRLHDSFNN